MPEARGPDPSGGFRIGILWKLLPAIVMVVAVVAATLAWRATIQLTDDLEASYRSKGEAIALALAAAAERSQKGDPLIIQNSIEANRRLSGVAYIFAKDQTDKVYASTFPSADLPAGLAGEASRDSAAFARGDEVHVRTHAYSDEGTVRHAIDVAAPVSRGALGIVHVGMDRDLIEAEVSSLQLSLIRWGAGCATLGIAALLAFVAWAVVAPVRELTRVTREIVQRGDLTQPIRVRSRDEVGQLGESFALMVEKLRDIPSGVRESAQMLATSVSKLSESTTEQSKTVTRQAAALQETQVTAQEIRQTSLLASQKADVVLKVAERGEALSRTGEAAVEHSLAALTAIRAEVEEIADRITRLGDKTIQIGNVAQTVKDLADQTNMLALNAAIEAVRSGEHGRGFAVVAREMRALADQSIQETKQARQMIEDTSAAIREAVAITERGVSRIDAGLREVRTSGETLTELSRIVKDNSSAVRQISAAISQQSAGISQIFGAVSDQSKMMDDTLERLGVTTESVETLKRASQRLVEIVDQFRV
jgi:methyl-accepting chemotaxis protein